MNIEIKKSLKPVNYNKAIKFLEKRLLGIHQNKSKYRNKSNNENMSSGLNLRGYFDFFCV